MVMGVPQNAESLGLTTSTVLMYSVSAPAPEHPGDFVTLTRWLSSSERVAVLLGIQSTSTTSENSVPVGSPSAGGQCAKEWA